MNKNKLLIDLAESETTKVGKKEFARQSLPQQVFSAIWEVESEVNNGGFSQYFSNSSAESASFVVEAFETIGLAELRISALPPSPLHFQKDYLARPKVSARWRKISQKRFLKS